jgi:hypothetical protein
MSHVAKLISLIPPVSAPRAFEVRSPADAREPVRLLRALSSGDQPSVVVIAPAPATRTGFEELVEAMMPAGEIPGPVDVLHARRNAEARWKLLSGFGALTAAQVAEAAGSRSKNTSALAGRWLRDGDVLAVTYQGTRYFPAFQFDEMGKPLPVIAHVLSHLTDVGEWQRGIWFITRSRLLGDARPVDLLRTAPERVIAAAKAGATPVD